MGFKARRHTKNIVAARENAQVVLKPSTTKSFLAAMGHEIDLSHKELANELDRTIETYSLLKVPQELQAGTVGLTSLYQDTRRARVRRWFGRILTTYVTWPLYDLFPNNWRIGALYAKTSSWDLD